MAESLNFEQSMSQLETCVKQLENGDLPIDKALELFEKGVTLYKNCHHLLDGAEQKVINLLKESDQNELS